MKLITNDRRECGDLIMSPPKHGDCHVALLLAMTDVVRSARPLGVINAEIRFKPANKYLKFTDIATYHTSKLALLKKNEGFGR